jgi:hypothetical protein
MIIPIAHAGHWLAGLLYLTPVLILVGGVLWQRHNDRRHPERHVAPDEGDQT